MSQTYFDGLHYNKANYEVNSEDVVQAEDVVESSSRQFLKNTSQVIEGVKTFTSNPILSGSGLSFDNLTIASNGNHTWSNNGLDKVLSATNASGASSSLTFENTGNTVLTAETGKVVSLKVGGTTRVQCSSFFKLLLAQLDIPFGTGTNIGGIKINSSLTTPTLLHTITGSDTFNINAPMTSLTGALNYTGFVTVSGTFNLTNTAMIYLADTSSASCSFRLTAATGQIGRYFTLIRKDSGSVNQLTINVGVNAQTINGSTSNITSTTPYESFKIFSDGTQWYTL